MVLTPAQADRFGQRPGAVRIKCDASFGKAFRQGGDRRHLLFAMQNAALQLEIVEAVAGVRGLGEADHRLWGESRLVTQA